MMNQNARPCFFFTLLLFLLSFSVSYAASTVAAVTSVTPDYVLDKQLPGEDPYWVYRPIFSPDGKYAAGFLHSPHKIIIWDLAAGKIIKEVEESVHGMPGLDGWAFSKDGTQLILIYRDLPIKYVDYMEGKIVRSVDAKADPKKVYDFSFSPDMKLLALATNNGIKLWDMDKGSQVKVFISDKAVSGVDMLYYRTQKGELVRMLAYGLLFTKGAENPKDMAGTINLDSGAVRPLLNDVPKEKVVKGDYTFYWVSFEQGGGYLLVGYSVIPPKVKAGVYLIDVRTGKYLANHDLDQCTLEFKFCYLWKPYYGYMIPDITMAENPYKTAIEFLVITKEGGLKVIDRTRENKIAAQSVTVSADQKWALIAVKKEQSDMSRVYLYKIVPKK